MADYTDTEIQLAVENLLRAKIRRLYEPLGTRQVEVTFTDIQEAASGVFLLVRDAPLYTCFLATQRLKDEVSKELVSISNLRETVLARTRVVENPMDSTGLAGARNALLELEAGLSTNTGTLKNLSGIPAYNRFQSNLGLFLSGTGQNVIQAGAISKTPEQAKKDLPGNLSDLQAQHLEVVRRLDLLKVAMEDYSKLNLPSLVARGVVQRARAVLDGHLAALDKLDDSQKNELTRQIVLDVLASKAVLRQVGNFEVPGKEYQASGTGAPYWDVDHPASPATVTGDVPGPRTITTGNNQIRITAELGKTLDVLLNPSTSAKIDSVYLGNSFEITGSNNKLLIGYGSEELPTEKLVTLTTGLTQTCADIANDINLAFTGTGLVAGEIDLGSSRRILRLLDTSSPALRKKITLPNHHTSTAPLAIGLFPGSISESSTSRMRDLASDIQAKTPFADINVSLSDTLSSLNCRTENFGLVSLFREKKYSVGVITVDVETITFTVPTIPMGVSTGWKVYITSGPSIGQLFTIDSITLVGGAIQLTARGPSGSTFDPTTDLEIGPSRATGERVLVTYLQRGRGKVEPGALSGILLLTPDASSGYQVATPGQKLILRSGPDFSTIWTVTGSLSDVLEASGPWTPTTSLDVEYEICDSGTVAEVGDILEITEGVNKGTYEVGGATGVAPFELLLSESLVSAPADPILMSVGRKKEYLKLSSKNTTLSSIIKIEQVPGNTGFFEFFSSPVSTKTNTTSWFQLPSVTKARVGDRIAFYATDYNTPSFLTTINTLIGNIASVSPEVPTTSTWTFSAASVPPFARVEDGQISTWGDLTYGLQAWEDGLSSTLFSNLTRIVNQLITNNHPASYVTGDAIAQLDALATSLNTLSTTLSNFTVNTVQELETLIRSLKEKGADRAVDLLLEGRFTTFFGLTVEEVSYAGNLMATIRSTAREDLPVRRVDRQDKYKPMTIASTESTDFEFDSSDTEEGKVVTPPTEFARR